jgi:plasmid stabilization system protein ParE
MEFTFSPEAEAEFKEGEDYYESQSPGLGRRFRADVRDGLRHLKNWPLAAPIERGEIRRLLLSHFPYKLLYSVEPDRIYIIAVAHLHRAPDYWTRRETQ